jgi:hypothetical protein
MISGSLLDKVGKRKICVLAGYGVSTACRSFFALTTGWLDAFVVRTTNRIGKGLRTAPRDELIADLISESISGKALKLLSFFPFKAIIVVYFFILVSSSPSSSSLV